MIDKSNIQQPAIDIGPISRTATGFAVELFVRWDEVASGGEYTYTAHRFIYPLPPEVAPGTDAVEYYVGQMESAIVLQAQNLMAQEEGFTE
jgi:hypothetical protein